MIRHPTPLALAALLALALPACKRLEAVPPGATITCGAPSECPAGLLCNAAGRCVDASNMTGATLASIVTASADRVPAGRPFTVTFDVSKPLERPPDVTLPGASVRLPCSEVSPLRYACTYTPSGTENGGSGGRFSVTVALRDRVGNLTTEENAASVTLDFAPPVPTIAGVAYEPSPANPLASVARATGGTVVRVIVSADEPLSPSRVPSLVGHLGPAELAFSPAAVPGQRANEAAFEATVPDLEPDGAYTLAVRWADDLDNAGEALVPATVEVKTSPPVLSVNQDALVLVRSPLGNAAEEPLGAYTLPAGPYFAVEPSDPFTSAPTLPAGSLVLGGGVLPSRVIVRSSPAANALVLGVLRPSGGLFPRQRLVTPDLVSAWLVGVDDAGNLSAPVRVAHTEWVATPRPPDLGAGAHGLLGTRTAQGTRAQPLAPAAVAPADVAGTDLASAVVRGAGAWQQVGWNGASPGARRRHAMAYDSARGRVVLFGGSNGGRPTDTWEWDGVAWTLAATGGPEWREFHALAYDSARERVVLFGGFGAAATFLGDTWEWDGVAWTQVASTGPSPRSGHAMVFDSKRRQVLVVGGSGSAGAAGETWAWDGAAWTLVSSTGPVPGRINPAASYDGWRDRVVLFGGYSASPGELGDTWEWDGTSWTSVTSVASAGPTARRYDGMAWDPVRRRSILFGGSTGTGVAGLVGDTWEWDGSAWTSVAVPAPSAREGHAVAYDVAGRVLVLFGGNDATGARSDTWLYDGTSWREAAKRGPVSPTRAAAAYDRGRGRVVMFGGASQDTWEWDGVAWTSVASTGPASRQAAALAYDERRGRVLLFGGYVPIVCFTFPCPITHYGDTWEWDGRSWAQVATTGPGPRQGAALAHDASRRLTILYGGSTGTADTWAWDGSGWTQLATTGPVAGTGHTLVYDRARAQLLLHAATGTGTWAWDGSGWTQLAGAGPAGAVAGAYDDARGRAVLVGPSGEVWEWDGALWSTVATVGPMAGTGAAVAFDAARSSLLAFTRNGGAGPLGETWVRRGGEADVPAIQLEVSLTPLGVDPALIESVSVRAFAGGTSSANGSGWSGVDLLGWAARGELGEPGGWVRLAANATRVAGGGPPWLPRAPASYVGWSSAGTGDVAQLLRATDPGRLTFQLRPAGPAGAPAEGAAVAVDYVEVRVRYTVPP